MSNDEQEVEYHKILEALKTIAWDSTDFHKINKEGKQQVSLESRSSTIEFKLICDLSDWNARTYILMKDGKLITAARFKCSTDEYIKLGDVMKEKILQLVEFL